MLETEPMKVPSPELEFLQICLKRTLQDSGSPGDPPFDPALSLPEHLDWRVLLTLAELHGVLAHVYPLLAPYAPEEFHAAFRAEWVSSQLLVSELVSLLEAFADSNIQVMPLKGPVLAETLFGDVTLRHAGDLDLLVDKRDYSAAEALLLRQGYVAIPASPTGFHWAFERENIIVELHFCLGDPGVCPLQTEEVWRRAVPAAFRGEPIRAMRQEDLILFLCFHLLKHGCSRLCWLVDIGRAVQPITAISWEVLLKAARKQRMECALLFCCALTPQVLGITLPQVVSADLDKQPAFARKASQRWDRKWFGLFAPSVAFLPNLVLFAEISPWRRWRFRLRNYFVPNAYYRERIAAHRFLGPLLLPFSPLPRLAHALRREGFLRYLRMFIANER
jgi:hypothetical protein